RGEAVLAALDGPPRFYARLAMGCIHHLDQAFGEAKTRFRQIQRVHECTDAVVGTDPSSF
ncbi:MAG: hypothetical protein J7601_05675, partial [Chloroflexi bacterium]|nr:hypothetical protein [Chloroflexota bacterium]